MTGDKSPRIATLPPRRNRAQFLVCMVLVASMEIASAQVAGPCSTGTAVAGAAQSAAGAARARVLADQDAHKQVLTNAMSCLQRIKDMLAMLTIPAFPDITAISMSKIIDFLSNKACQVVVSQVQTVVDPVINTLGGTQSQINALASTVNGVSNQIGGGNVVVGGGGGGIVCNGNECKLTGVFDAPATTGGGIPGFGPGGPNAPPVSTWPQQQQQQQESQQNRSQAQDSSVWSRVGCTFSFGSNCP